MDAMNARKVAALLKLAAKAADKRAKALAVAERAEARMNALIAHTDEVTETHAVEALLANN